MLKPVVDRELVVKVVSDSTLVARRFRGFDADRLDGYALLKAVIEQSDSTTIRVVRLK